MNLPLKMSAEMFAIMMIGDGMLALTQPRRHMRLWNAGPEPWRKLCSYFEQRPAQTMAVGAASIGLGLWLASALRRDSAEAQRGRLRAAPEDNDDVVERVAYSRSITETAQVTPGL